MPIISKAWNAMATESLHPNGMLGYVQGTGKEPKDGQPVTYDKIPDFEDYGLGCFLLAGTEIYQIATPPAANLDESKVPPYVEPALLHLSTAREWESGFRPQLYRDFEDNVYGRIPNIDIPVSYNTDAVDEDALNGVATKKQITIRLSPTDTAARIHLMLYLPKRAKGQGSGLRRLGYTECRHRYQQTVAAKRNHHPRIWCRSGLVLGYRTRPRRRLADGHPYTPRGPAPHSAL